jgi:hypothetical protein
VLFGVEQASMGKVRNSLKISFRQLYVDRLEVVGKKKGWPSILFLLPTAQQQIAEYRNYSKNIRPR